MRWSSIGPFEEEELCGANDFDLAVVRVSYVHSNIRRVTNNNCGLTGTRFRCRNRVIGAYQALEGVLCTSHDWILGFYHIKSVISIRLLVHIKEVYIHAIIF